MSGSPRDPVAADADEETDLYGIAEWEVRSTFDRLVYTGYYGSLWLIRAIVVLVAVLALVAQFVLGGLGAVVDPILGAFTILSAVPAAVLAAYVWKADVTTREPLSLLVGTFTLGVLFASFAGVLNTELGPVVEQLASFGGLVPILGTAAFYFLIVGPVEEGVKLLAVRTFAFRSDRFDAVIDGAVYGAVAGLGFATIENALYITQNTDAAVSLANAIQEAGSITAARSLAGPGHVIYSAFAGYYLGLAKFNREHAGPIVLKGLVIAALIHGAYNTLVGIVPAVIAVLTPLGPIAGFLVFIVVFDGLFAGLLLVKLRRYADAYHETHPPDASFQSEPTEFDA
jgi:RsiW-degrading membrane proteinase PrsW (M82 family)